MIIIIIHFYPEIGPISTMFSFHNKNQNQCPRGKIYFPLFPTEELIGFKEAVIILD